MKKFFLYYFYLFIAVVCITSFLGVRAINYRSALHGTVSLINKVGDVSQDVVRTLISVDDIDVEEINDLPFSYRQAYVQIEEHHRDCRSATCQFYTPDKVLLFIKNSFCSDYAYYLENESDSVLLNRQLAAVSNRLINGPDSFVNFKNFFTRNKLNDIEKEAFNNIYSRYMSEGCKDDLMIIGSTSISLYDRAITICNGGN